MPNRLIALVFVALMFASGCATPDSFVDYLNDRRHDLIDAANVNVTGLQFGAIACAGPAQLGYAENVTFGPDNSVGIGPYGTWPRLNVTQLGLGGPRETYVNGVASGVVWPFERWNSDTRMFGERWNSERPMFGERPRQKPSVTSVGFSLGFLLGIGAEVDAWQALDFALGLFCIDIGGDDHVIRGGEHEIKRLHTIGFIGSDYPVLRTCTAPCFNKLRTFSITVDEARKKVEECRGDTTGRRSPLHHRR